MAHKLHALVGESSTTTGTGPLTLNAALDEHRRFSLVLSVGDTTEVMIRHANDGSFEHSICTYSATDTLTRTSVSESSNANAAVSFAAGGLTVVLTPLSARLALISQTLTNPTIAGSITEGTSALTGTTPALSAANGTIQTWTLTGNSTPTDGLSSGQSLTLMIDDGSAYSITWPTMTWVGGSAPTLSTTGYTVVELWKIGSALRGSSPGSVA